MKKEFDFKTKFPPLGHPEHHFNKYPNHPWLKSKDDINQWLKRNSKDYTPVSVNEDLTISLLEFGNDLDSSYKEGLIIPVQFKYSNLRLNEVNVLSTIGFPYKSQMWDLYNSNIKSFEDIYADVSRLNVNKNKFENFSSFKNIKIRRMMIKDNPINACEGELSCNELEWWQEEWCEKTSYILLAESPENIKNIIVSEGFDSPLIKKKMKNKIDMEWLREERLKWKTEKIKKEINLELDNSSKDTRRRKI